ncbi:MAG: N-6 DNA methylase [Nanoarchaeota archaeon]|nr:N-6 DNA methylase [Nanoarchaeota archaeon]
MLDSETKRRIDTARDILVGKIPDPKSQIEQITIALIYKFMDDMDKKSEELGGKAKFFTGDYIKYSWSKLLDPSVSGFELVNVYGEAIQSMNQNPNLPQLFRDIFKNAYLPYRDPETLKAFLRIIDDFKYDHSERLGDAFEYLLSVMGSQGDAGQFRTPRHIIEFIVDVVDPSINDTILDPACGTAGFLISAYKHILEKNMHEGKNNLTPDERKKLVENVVGYDISPDMVRLSLVNLYLHGFKDPHIYEYDTLTSDEKWDDTFDVCLANPPFMTPKGGIRPHKRFSVSSNRAEVLFVDYMAEHLNNDGRAGIVVPEGIIFQSGNTYKQLRKMLIDNSLYAVASLPAGVFNPYSGVKTSVLFLDKRIAKKTKDILFVKVEAEGYNLGAQRREIKDNDLPLALEVIQEFQNAILEGIEPKLEKFEKTIAHIVPKEKIAEQGYNLSGDRYKEEVVYDGNWDLLKVEELVEKVTYTNKIQKKEFKDKGKYPIIDQAENYIAGYWNNKEDVFIIEKPVVIFGDHTRCFKYIDFNFVLGADGVKILQPISKLNTRFFYYMLKNLEIKNLGYSRHYKELKEMSIPLPPLEIQERIVEEIESYQNIIDGAKKVVDSYKPSFKIDPKWAVVELGEACDVRDGTHDSPQYVHEGYPLVTSKNVKDGTIDFTNVSYVSKEDFDNINKRSLVEDGDIIMPMIGTIGSPIVVKKDREFAIKNVALVKFKENKKANNYFINYVLSSELFESYIDKVSRGGTQKFISLKNIRNFKTPLPPIETQKEIVAKIEEEQKLVNSNKQLIEIFEKKIKDKIAEVWGE